MNLLIDFLTAHGRYGAGEYQRRIVMTLIEKIQKMHISDVHLFALFDSTKEISFEDLQEENLSKIIPIKYCDLQEKDLLKIIEENKIDRFFIACGQRIGEYPEIANVDCDVVCVTHDLLYEEWYYNHMYEYWSSLRPMQSLPPKSSLWRRGLKKLKKIIKKLIKKNNRNSSQNLEEKMLGYMDAVVTMLKKNLKARCVMVSEYSKTTMVYNYHIDAEKIEVYYSPERIETPISPIENKNLADLIESGAKYYIMLSCDRESKNPIKALHAFKRYLEIHPEVHFVMIGMLPYFGECTGNIHAMDFLSDSDLAWALKSCYALVYPSFFEGFGYPPIEAMRYGKPVICSNVTSLPGILEEAPIYCSPLYESSIFGALLKLNDDNYNDYSKRSWEQYKKLKIRQEQDLHKLTDMILKPLE